jgi:hypothetical protein
MTTSPLKELERWYLSNCDGDWEHSFGITITTIDNPGWRIDISLRETSWEDIRCDRVVIERDENDWINCVIENGVFLGACGPTNFHEVLELFLRIVGTP